MENNYFRLILWVALMMNMTGCAFFENQAANAVSGNKTFKLKTLMAFGVSPNAVVEGDPLLTIAQDMSIFGGFEVSKILLEHGANPNIGGVKGVTPLMSAVRNGLTSNVLLLLQNGANPNQIDQDGQTAFFYLSAKESSSPQIFRDLVTHGGNPCSSDHKKMTPADFIRDISSNPELISLFKNGCK